LASGGRRSSEAKDSPGLQALLANTPSSDVPASSNAADNHTVPASPSILERLVSGGGGVTPTSSLSRQASTEGNRGSISQDAPGLQALLANAPSADHPIAGNSLSDATAATSGGSLPGGQGRSLILERLVSGGSPAVSASQNGSPVRAGVSNTASSNDSTQEITLATILAKPPMASPNVASTGTPSKTSPLLQQLQQPVQGVSGNNNNKILSSPARHPPSMSPSSRQPPKSLPQPAQSPGGRNSFSMPQSPSAKTQTQSTLQQQLMQPPGLRVQQVLQQQQQQPTVTMVTVPVVGDILAVSGQTSQGQQPQQHILTNGIVSNGQQQQATQGNQQPSVVNLQNLLQSGVVVSSSNNAGVQPNTVQLQIPGLASPVTLSLANVQQQQDGNQGQGMLVAQQQQPQKTTKLATTSGGVVFQQATGNSFIQLPQQPAIKVSSPQQQVLQVRQGSGQAVTGQQQQQVFLQMQGQPMIVRTLPQAVATAASLGASANMVQVNHTLKSPPPPLPTAATGGLPAAATPSPQTPGVPQSPSGSSVASLASPQPAGAGDVTTAQQQLKISHRTGRKQSLK